MIDSSSQMIAPTSDEIVNAYTARVVGARTNKLLIDVTKVQGMLGDDGSVPFTRVEVEQQHAINPDRKNVILSTSIRYIIDGQHNFVVLEYEAEIAFRLDKFEEWVTIDGENAVVKPIVLSQLSQLAMSTIRGILIEKLSNTVLGKSYLPLFDDSSLVQ